MEKKVPFTKLCDYSDDEVEDSSSSYGSSCESDLNSSVISAERTKKSSTVEEQDVEILSVTQSADSSARSALLKLQVETPAKLSGECGLHDFKDVIAVNGVSTGDKVESSTLEVDKDDRNFRERRMSNSSDKSDSSSSLSSTSSGELDISPDSSDDEESHQVQQADGTTTKEKRPKENPRVKGELSLQDLEPIVDLHISIPENKTEHIGQVLGVVDVLVTVESYDGKPALDLGSLLFVDGGKRTLGHIFDVFGPTRQPYYCVRFNSVDHIKERGIKVGDPVYAAPGTEYTRYVFLSQLERLKGTDASWKDDHETPNEYQDFSDDEQEKVAKGKGRRYRARKVPIDRSLPPPAEPTVDTIDRSTRKRNFDQHENSAPPSNWYSAQAYRPTVPQFGGPTLHSYSGGAYRPQMPHYPPQQIHGMPGGFHRFPHPQMPSVDPNFMQQKADPQFHPFNPFMNESSRPNYQYQTQPQLQYPQAYTWYNYDSATHPGNWYAANPSMYNATANWQGYSPNATIVAPPVPNPQAKSANAPT